MQYIKPYFKILNPEFKILQMQNIQSHFNFKFYGGGGSIYYWILSDFKFYLKDDSINYGILNPFDKIIFFWRGNSKYYSHNVVKLLSNRKWKSKGKDLRMCNINKQHIYSSDLNILNQLLVHITKSSYLRQNSYQ